MCECVCVCVWCVWCVCVCVCVRECVCVWGGDDNMTFQFVFPMEKCPFQETMSSCGHMTG